MTGAACRRPCLRQAGFSLVELLVATAIASVVLAGGWAWCWTVSGTCAVGCERCDARSSLAFAQRLSAGELGQCVVLVSTPDARCSATSIAFVVPSGHGPTTELVTYVWDPARRVLWRKASGSHLAEGVDEFAVVYFDGQGRPLPLASGGELPDADLSLVRRVELTAVVRCEAQTVSAAWQICLPCPA